MMEEIKKSEQENTKKEDKKEKEDEENNDIVAPICADGEMIGGLPDVDVNATQDTTDEKKCFGDIRPSDIPYEEHMKIVRENEELKETIVKLVKKLNEHKFFD